MNRRELLASTLAVAGASLVSSTVTAAVPQSDAFRVPASGKINVAFVIGDHANLMDIAGPWESLQDVNLPSHNDDTAFPFKLATVSDSKAPLRTAGGMTIVPSFTYDDIPQPNIIVMGAQGEHTEKKIAWIKAAAPKADVIMSVCTGAFLLAKTGLLDGRRATTHHDFYDKFAAQFPKVELVRGPRYVENGNILTAGGLTSGIELALRVVQRYFGDAPAAQTAAYMEYNRSPHRPIG